MNLRKRAKPEIYGFQIAPMVDILLVLLVFFIMTWNFALSESELDVKMPTASNSKPADEHIGQVVVNIRADGTIVLNQKVLTPADLLDRLKQLSGLSPNQAVIIRGDRGVQYKYIVDVLDICRTANIWNIAFAAVNPKQN